MGRLLASCFGLGRLPLAPGTWGSLPAAIIFGLMWHFHASGILISIVMAALALAGSIVCVRFAPVVIRATGKGDPGEVVADELAGCCRRISRPGGYVFIHSVFNLRDILNRTNLGYYSGRFFAVQIVRYCQALSDTQT